MSIRPHPPLSPLPERKVGIGEIGVVIEQGILKTLLGSCIGLVLHDPKCRVGGLAHIVLPKAGDSTHPLGKYAETAIPELIRMIHQAGGRPGKLVAKYAGGANMFGTMKMSNIGEQNAAEVERLLQAACIPILGRHCGGGQGRRLAYDVATGTVVVEIVGQPPLSL